MEKKYIIISITFFILTLLLCIFVIKNNAIAFERYNLEDEKPICENINLGGFSDLFYKDGYFYTITDRGPCTKKVKLDEGKGKVFPCKGYKPKIIKFESDNGKIKILSINDIKNVTGIPIAKKRDTVPLDINEKILPFDINGLDSESMIIDNEGNYWVGDEYYPSIAKIDKNFNVIKRFAPIDSKYKNPKISYILPEELNKTKKNKGFEAMAYDGNEKIYVFTQSISKKLDYIIVIEFNIKSEQVENVFEYMPYDQNEYISGAVFIKDKNKIVTIGKINSKIILNTFKISEDKLLKTSTKDLTKSLKLDKSTKFEGIAYNEDENSFYIINDNDFGLKSDDETKSYMLKFKL